MPPPLPLPLLSARLSLAPDGTPVSDIYGDIYHSAAGGHAQALHVFLAGNGLPERWRGGDSLVILETGFGLGVNFLATWLAWRNDARRCRTLRFISLEKHPFAADDLAIAHAIWPEFAELSALLRTRWPKLVAGEHRIELEGGGIDLRLVFGDATETLPRLDGAVDAFYLDGFSPAKNPDLWSPAICQNLARLAGPNATLATWSVAGGVRRALSAAGFAVEKRTGFAGKRQMLVGRHA
ncbi:MAG: tRNA (5-methylaminomethyl-2-thiouridine)(34)-methyltransferase MnmD [Candidatus Accumulibacter sp.]|jgi:tRNA 5-methylaminomethyl-2-thiouridine biosynthesis bifunctional protein|nr:tRNA (5-methylaminomethyl-2-thiouridine)(34)-methyltransferase MnmD [Accumulibacter sp.]